VRARDRARAVGHSTEAYGRVTLLLGVDQNSSESVRYENRDDFPGEVRRSRLAGLVQNFLSCFGRPGGRSYPGAAVLRGSGGSAWRNDGGVAAPARMILRSAVSIGSAAYRRAIARERPWFFARWIVGKSIFQRSAIERPGRSKNEHRTCPIRPRVRRASGSLERAREEERPEWATSWSWRVASRPISEAIRDTALPIPSCRCSPMRFARFATKRFETHVSRNARRCSTETFRETNTTSGRALGWHLRCLLVPHRQRDRFRLDFLEPSSSIRSGICWESGASVAASPIGKIA